MKQSPAHGAGGDVEMSVLLEDRNVNHEPEGQVKTLRQTDVIFMDPVNKKLCTYVNFKCNLLQRKSPLYNPEGYAGVKIIDNYLFFCY